MKDSTKKIERELSRNPRRLLAMAGNYREFRVLTGDSYNRYTYLPSAQDIRGYANAELDLMGRWRTNDAIWKDVDKLREYCETHDIVIREQ